MIEKIKSVISEINELDEWKIVEKKIYSKEVFFVKKDIDMNRGKDVCHYNVTVYKNFQEDNKKYKGSSTINIHPTMTKKEIRNALEDALFAAGFVKNEYYSLVEGKNNESLEIKSNLDEDSFSNWLPRIIDAIYKEDVYSRGKINSAELFLDKINVRIVNSNGLDVSYSGYNGMLEFIVNWYGEKEEVEVYKNIKFTEFDEKMLSNEVKKLLKLAREKSTAVFTPKMKNIDVILSGDPVKEFLSYYYSKSNAAMIYEGLSTFKVGDSIQGEDVLGDRINMNLDPLLENSTISKPYDEDGFLLDKVNVIKDGVLDKVWGDCRHCYYLGVEPTGQIGNFIIEGGNKSCDEFKHNSYLEVVSFSDFQIDRITGDFGGEIRLGWYFDGHKIVTITGGSISGNINQAEKEMYLSKEMQKINNFIGPKSIKLSNVVVSGVD